MTDKEKTETTTTKGFMPINKVGVRYPRWLGRNYQTQHERTQEGTHASPYTHWRSGHWRILESGEGKRWREDKRIWIEPVLVMG